MAHGPIPDKPEIEFDPETGYWYGEPIKIPPEIIEAWRKAAPLSLEDPCPQAGSPSEDQLLLDYLGYRS
jgi:hypothetical protein